MGDARFDFPALGFGLGLRTAHYAHILEQRPKVDWFEIISENFMETDGPPRRNLARIAAHYPIVMHGVGLSIGTVDPLNSDYLAKLKALAEAVKPAWISDHLCWTGVAHKNTHDLLPVPYTEEALAHIVDRIRAVQDYLGRPILLENPSTYLEFTSSTMPEAEFLARMAEEADCGLLLDVNNVYVSCYNHRLDPKTYLDTLPMARVGQIHLSGHSNYGTHIIDTHDDHVTDEVWALYRYALARAGRSINTMIEWDDQIPEFPVLFAELEKARALAQRGAGELVLPELAKLRAPYRDNQPLVLAAAEARMQQAILAGRDAAPAEWIRNKTDFAPQEQLAVYLEGYRYRLFDTVAEEYPVLAHYLGEAKFNTLLEEFIEAVPATHFNIGHYAHKLPDFLAQHKSGDAFASELATLEATLSQLHDAKESEALTPEHLAGMTAEALMEAPLALRAASALLAFAYPVNAYYGAVVKQSAPTPPAPQASYLALLRHDDQLWRLPLEEAEYALLTLLAQGLPVGAALELLGESATASLEEWQGKLSAWFGSWIRNGLLARYEVTDSNTRSAA